MPNVTYTFLANLKGPPDTGLLETKEGCPAVVVFTNDEAAETFVKRNDSVSWEPWILTPRKYIARLRENHDTCNVRWALIDPDEQGLGGREEKLLRLIDDLEKAHQLGPYRA